VRIKKEERKMTRTLTVYKFVSLDDDATVSVLMSALEVTRVEVVSREIVSFFIMDFDDYDELTGEEITFLQENFDGYYLVVNGVAIEIYSDQRGKYVKTIPVLLAELRERAKLKTE
jgi:hypothetical protein